MSLYTIHFSGSESDSPGPPPVVVQTKKETRRKRTRKFHKTDPTYVVTEKVGISINYPNPEGMPKEELQPQNETEEEDSISSEFRIPEEKVQQTPQPKAKRTESQNIALSDTKSLSYTQLVDPTPAPRHKNFTISKDWVSYTLVRSKVHHIYGKRCLFKFSQDSNFLYSAKYKANADFVPISQDPECHVNSPANESFLCIANSAHDFALKEGSITGRELMTIRFFPVEYQKLPFRRCVIVIFFKQGQSDLLRLYSKNPREEKNELIYDFEDRDCVPSIRNCALFENAASGTLIMCRKTSNNTLIIESKIIMSPLILFAISLANYISNVK